MNLKNSFIILLLVLIFSSCVTQKKCLQKFPPQIIREVYDSIIIKDSIIYRDIEIEVKIPGDTIEVEKKVPIKENISPVTVENTYSSAKAWVENSKLKLQLIQKDQLIKYKVDSAIQVAKHWEYRWNIEKQKEVIKEKYIPKIYSIAFYMWIGVIVIVLLYLGFKYLK